MVRGALSALLNLDEDIEVLGSCADGASAWIEAQRLRPDVIVSDIEMPGMTGLELAMRVPSGSGRYYASPERACPRPILRRS